MIVYDLPGIINISLNLATTHANIKVELLINVILSYNRFLMRNYYHSTSETKDIHPQTV
jgi:hypothetical protein